MFHRFPGTTIEVSRPEKGCSVQLFDGIFATGGITLSQVSVMTGLEPYLVQNWVKRGFVSSPQRRTYTRAQFARIVMINMLRESLQIEKICGFLRVIGGEPDDPEDDLIEDDRLYHLYVDMVAGGSVNTTDRQEVRRLAEEAASAAEVSSAFARGQLSRVLEVMVYAHAAAELRHAAEESLGSLQ